MRRKVFAIGAIILLLFTIALYSCDESEPLPVGVSKLEDLTPSELAESLADDSGVIQWPEALLPEGFPVPQYEEIYSVSREDNELRIVLLAKKYMLSDAPHIAFTNKLAESGYAFYVPKNQRIEGIMAAVNRDGWRVQMYSSSYSERLSSLAEKYGYAYEINVRQIADDYADSFFWEFPSPDTDLGYESKKLTEWPTELLPEGFPIPDSDKIASMEVRPNGIFITVKEFVAGQTYENRLYDAGFYKMSRQPHRDKNGNYYFTTTSSLVTGDNPEDAYYYVTFQICMYNEKIKK